MDTKKLLIGCTAALIVCMTICTYVLYEKLDDIWRVIIDVSVYIERASQELRR